MKAETLQVHWHETRPIYSAHFEPSGKGRLATAGGDNIVRVWKLERKDDGSHVVNYLSTLAKHTQAVNVVRFSPRGNQIASAGDDGNVLIWVPSETREHVLGETSADLEDEKENWRVKHMCRSTGSEIYDLAWSPDGVFIITGSMDNIARIYDARDGNVVRQIADHQHYVQGVAWDPLNEFIATQSSDRSVHIYALKNADGQFSLSHYNRSMKIELPSRRISNGSPVPPDFMKPPVSATSALSESIASPVPSTPGTPTSMQPPMTHSRRSSFSNSPAFRRSASPSPAFPLPAVKPMSPRMTEPRTVPLYYNEALASFFRRLTFAPDGSLLFTPAGKLKRTSTADAKDLTNEKTDDIINTVFIYSRAGLKKPPIAHLPGHKKPAIAIKCSPIYYKLHKAEVATTRLTMDTSLASQPTMGLPESDFEAKSKDLPPAFVLPYRMVYAVATQDAVVIYDTQQHSPLYILSNLHYATFTDLSWTPDGRTLLMTSNDGFCSVVSFDAEELGEIHPGPSLPPPVIIGKHGPQSPKLARACSPARSNSTSSVATLSSFGIIPGNMPPAAMSSAIGSTSPPMSHSNMLQAPEMVLGKRDAETPSSSENGSAVKKRRLTPTLVSELNENQNQ